MRWLWYAMGGGLPPEYREWVLNDLTARGWWLRQLLRSIVQIVPFAVLILLFLPSEFWVRVLAVLGGACVGMVYAIAYLDEATEHRALKAGYARGTLGAVRAERNAGRIEAQAERYRERYRGEPPTPRSSA